MKLIHSFVKRQRSLVLAFFFHDFPVLNTSTFADYSHVLTYMVMNSAKHRTKTPESEHSKSCEYVSPHRSSTPNSRINSVNPRSRSIYINHKKKFNEVKKERRKKRKISTWCLTAASSFQADDSNNESISSRERH